MTEYIYKVNQLEKQNYNLIVSNKQIEKEKLDIERELIIKKRELEETKNKIDKFIILLTIESFICAGLLILLLIR